MISLYKYIYEFTCNIYDHDAHNVYNAQVQCLYEIVCTLVHKSIELLTINYPDDITI